MRTTLYTPGYDAMVRRAKRRRKARGERKERLYAKVCAASPAVAQELTMAQVYALIVATNTSWNPHWLKAHPEEEGGPKDVRVVSVFAGLSEHTLESLVRKGLAEWYTVSPVGHERPENEHRQRIQLTAKGLAWGRKLRELASDERGVKHGG
jgi:hypothetical protein